jgi:hypothetical protein
MGIINSKVTRREQVTATRGIRSKTTNLHLENQRNGNVPKLKKKGLMHLRTDTMQKTEGK